MHDVKRKALVVGQSVGEVQRARDIRHDPAGHAKVELVDAALLLEQLSHAGPVDELLNQEGYAPFGLPELGDPRNVGVLKPGPDPCLIDEHRHVLGTRHVLGLDGLDHHAFGKAARTLQLAEPGVGHASLPELGLDEVASYSGFEVRFHRLVVYHQDLSTKRGWPNHGHGPHAGRENDVIIASLQ